MGNPELSQLAGPVAWLYLSIVAAGACSLWVWNRRGPRVALLFSTALVLAVGVAEAAARWRISRLQQTQLSYGSGYHRFDPEIGSRPARGSATRSTLHIDGRPVYDVSYGIDERGLRRGPESDGRNVERCVAFFGGSFTFGEGVEDDEALPYQVALLSEGRVESFNFGFHGHGPHHMLAALEAGFARAAVHCSLTHVVYQLLPNHVRRAAGKVSWNRGAPRYDLGSEGELRRTGRYDSGLTGRVSKAVYTSGLGRLLFPTLVRTTDRDVARTLAIFREARRIVLIASPEARFDVLLWRPFRAREAWVYEALSQDLPEAGFQVHPVEDILPGYRDRPSDWALDAGDPHPSPAAHQLIGTYVVEEVLDLERGVDPEEDVPATAQRR